MPGVSILDSCLTLSKTFWYSWMRTWRWELEQPVNTLMMAASSVPNPFMAFRSASTSCVTGRGTRVLMVGRLS